MNQSKVNEGRQLSRREFSWMLMGLIGSSSFVLNGCGGLFGGSGGSGGGLRSVTGSLTLPAGVDPSELVVTCSGGTVPVTSGAFRAQIASGSPSLLIAIHATSHLVVLMGFADPAGGAI